MHSCVFIPGLLSTPTVWQHLVSDLPELQAPVFITFHGEDTAEKMVHTILQQAPDHFALIGHSMGAWLALEVMRQAPERVVKLCLLNATARPDSSEKRAMRQTLISRAKRGEFAQIAKELAEKMVFQKQVKPQVEKMFLQAGMQRLIDDEHAMLARKESMSILPQIHVPTLLLHAKKDQVFSLQEHEEMAALIHTAKLAIIEKSGHMSPMEQPQAVAMHIRNWLM